LFDQVDGFDDGLFKVDGGKDWDIDKLINQNGIIFLLDESFQQDQKLLPELLDFIKCRVALLLNKEPMIHHNEIDFELLQISLK
jgi:hypothetical protein